MVILTRSDLFQPGPTWPKSGQATCRPETDRWARSTDWAQILKRPPSLVSILTCNYFQTQRFDSGIAAQGRLKAAEDESRGHILHQFEMLQKWSEKYMYNLLLVTKFFFFTIEITPTRLWFSLGRYEVQVDNLSFMASRATNETWGTINLWLLGIFNSAREIMLRRCKVYGPLLLKAEVEDVDLQIETLSVQTWRYVIGSYWSTRWDQMGYMHLI